MIPRITDINAFDSSLFLFGPRQVGKTSLIKNTTSPDIFIDLLDQREYLRYAHDPNILSREVTALSQEKEKLLVIIDEIQQCPSLLNEVHRVIENEPRIKFILTGSSARKLRRAGVNLLGGRALTVHLHPLTFLELKDLFSLEEVLHFGSLPNIILDKEETNKIRKLRSYVENYLKEEIQQEALTRNVPAFAKFLELAAYENGHLINFQNIAREVGIHSKTIKEYFNILEDTLLGFLFYPYARSHRKRIIAHPKFYFFDTGVVSALRGELTKKTPNGTIAYGNNFEHFIILEIKRILDYSEKEVKISFFRTSDGAEVDLILEFADEIWAIEIKSSMQPKPQDIRGLKSFIKDHSCKRQICICQTPRPYILDKIEIIPWQNFLKELLLPRKF